MGHLIAPFLIVPVLVLAGFLFAASLRGHTAAKPALAPIAVPLAGRA